MNTNNNSYTVIYTTVIVVLVAAVLAFVSQSLKSRQEANEKADTISQMLTAAAFGTKAEFQAMGNAAVLEKYGEEIDMHDRRRRQQERRPRHRVQAGVFSGRT